MEAKEVRKLMEAYASVYTQPEEVIAEAECECEDEKEDEESMEMNGKKKSKKKELTNEDLQQTVDTALKAGQKFMKTNPVGKALGAVIAPVGAGRGTVTAAEQQKKVQQNVTKEEVEEVDEAMSSYDRNRKRAAQRAAERNAARDRGQTGNVPGVGYVSPRRERETYTDESGQERHKSGARMPKKEDQKESFDLFDYLLEYLVAEGYADTNKAALAIMANMSEEWKQNIIEQMTVNVADVKGGTQAAKNAQAGMKDKSGNPMYKPGVGVGPDFKLKGV
jgi:hypothetical protein